MNRAKKNKGRHNNPKGNQTMTRDERSLKDLLRDFAKDWEARQKELVEKHNSMASQLAAQEHLIKQVANFSAAEIGKMMAKLNLYFQSVDGALHHHDVNDLAMSELLKEIFGQLTQIDTVFRKANMSSELSDEDIENIKKEATEWFQATTASAFQKANETVQAQQKEAEEKRKAAEAALAAEKEKAAADKAEAERMEAEFQASEKQDRGLAPSSGHTEAEKLGLPPDVRVFGMT